jgi:tetratricopeptide (TPR) repeat protein
VSALKPLPVPGLIFLAILPACSPVQAPRSAALPPPAGVIVESVIPHSPGAVAGLLPEDVILSWSSAASQGDVSSPHDLLPLEIEEAPRRAVTLRGRRGGEERVWVLTAGDWGIATRPAGDGLASWFLDRRARELSEERKWPEADAAFQEAVEAVEREAGPVVVANLLCAWAGTFHLRGDWDAAVERYQKALALAGPKSLGAAQTLIGLGYTRAKMGDFKAGEELLRQALAIQEELAPGTTEVAVTLNKLGVLSRWRGDLNTAEEYLTRAGELQRRLAPDSVGYGKVLLNLGNVAQERGDLEEAEGFQRRALAIFEKIEPFGGLVTGSLQNLVNVAILRGDLALADDLLRRILDLQERRGASNWEAWSTLTNLGNIAVERGDLEAAEDHYGRALVIQEGKPSPDGREVALSLGSLGELALLKGDFATARDYLERAQEIEDSLAPESLAAAEGLQSLAHLEIESGGDLAKAEKLLQRALAIYEEEAPASLGASLVLRHLGEIVGQRGRQEEAVAFHRRALDIQSRLGPGEHRRARFMKGFYGHLRSGKTKDEALRAAQIEQVRESHPFHWAAFQLTRDWR